ncbi:hypothetical protein COY32_05210 [candidate division WWE3 bacterium CG_4_10_14_0_2_um_filter_41_14]|uniref:Polymerase nucleotidyl transferase domain-containing protein n=1 Tax=candidate division WWE3 bacterium CG_4_10_14_0_2_um_filter_41_14 TaxID=1975072 RepID=A0A2M7TH68_UNCKA|nr:MAG: hypothetical protein COY32_05210 [candidate division WWE3 bacterium CG_4_10_14_0_2_um_filter_41_14]
MPETLTTPIRNIGTVIKANHDGYLVNNLLETSIVEPWKGVVDEMIVTYKEILSGSLHSIYVRGSVARGTAVEGISDIDSIAVVNLEPGSFEDKQELLREIAIGFEKKYPFSVFVELQAKPLQPILDLENRIFRVLVHTTSICVYGENLATILPPIKPGSESVVVSYNFPTILNEAIEQFSNSEFHVKAWHCRKLMRNLVRSGFEIVMEREQLWTRDLYPSYAYFAKNYPDYKDDMYQALTYSLNPMVDREKVLFLATNLGRFVETEISRYLNP